MVTLLNDYEQQIYFLNTSDSIDGIVFRNGDQVFLMDQDLLLVYDQENDNWQPVPTGGGGGGGDYVAGDWLDKTKPAGRVESDVSWTSTDTQHLLYGRTGVTSVYLPETVNVPSLTFAYCTNLVTAVHPKTTAVKSEAYRGCSKLIAVDTKGLGSGSYAFADCPKLGLLVLRSTSVTSVHANELNSTRFGSGGAGGTIYIPKVLYDQLGTGTNDYRAATNWATYDAYGTITWAQIEGIRLHGRQYSFVPIGAAVIRL